MPELAQAIRNDFAGYTCDHPIIHLSAGIAVVGGKAPLYTAADEAHEALEAAKHLDFGTPNSKNAISFLGRSHHWDAFEVVAKLQQRIFDLVDQQKLPVSLITRLQAIERRYEEDIQNGRGQEGERLAQTGKTIKVFYGPWMWRQAYAIPRLGYSNSASKQDLKQLENDLLDGRIEFLGLAARWAQWRTRKE